MGQNWSDEAMHQRTSDFVCNLLMCEQRHMHGKGLTQVHQQGRLTSLETVLRLAENRAQTHPAPLPPPPSPEADSTHRLAANVTLFGKCWYQGKEWEGRYKRRRGSVPLSPVMA